jgi:hypothetical protein
MNDIPCPHCGKNVFLAGGNLVPPDVPELTCRQCRKPVPLNGEQFIQAWGFTCWAMAFAPAWIVIVFTRSFERGFSWLLPLFAIGFAAAYAIPSLLLGLVLGYRKAKKLGLQMPKKGE